MKEITFLVEYAPEGGYTARALGYSIFTEADSLPELRMNIKEALACHFERIEDIPRLAHLHIVKDEILAIDNEIAS